MIKSPVNENSFLAYNFCENLDFIERCQRFRIMNVNYNSNKLGLKTTTDCVDLLIVMFVCTSCECE